MIPRRGCGRMPALASKTKPRKMKESPEPEVQRQDGRVSAPSGERHQNEGHGRRLTAAFEALEAFPALAESRDRLLVVTSGATSRPLTWSPRSSPTSR